MRDGATPHWSRLRCVALAAVLACVLAAPAEAAGKPRALVLSQARSPVVSALGSHTNVRLKRGGKARTHNPKRYDLLVLDILMPGATGWEVHARALERVPAGSHLPRAILMTGFQQEYVVDFRVLQEEGVGAMLLKPFPASTVLDEAARLLAEPPPVPSKRPSGAAKP